MCVTKPFVYSLHSGVEAIHIPCRDSHIKNLAPASLHDREERIISFRSFI